MNWLDSLQVGSAVVVVDPRGHLRVSKVTAISKARARITVGIRQYSGATGRETGANEWSYWKICELTPELRSEVIDQQRVRRAKITIDQAIDSLKELKQQVNANNAYVVIDAASDLVERISAITHP